MINIHYKYKERCEKILNGYRTEEFRNKVYSSHLGIPEDWKDIIPKFFNNEELMNKEYQIILKLIKQTIEHDYDQIEFLIKDMNFENAKTIYLDENDNRKLTNLMIKKR